MGITAQQSKPKRWIRPCALLFLVLTLLPVVLLGTASSTRGRVAASTQKPAEPPVTRHGERALAQLKQQGNYDSLAAAMRQARYSVSRVDSTPLGRAAWHAPNPANGYDGYVTEEGVSISLSRAAGKAAYVSLTLRGIGYGDGLQYVGGGEVSGEQQKIRIERNGQFNSLKEWYVNSESGLEQGFTLTEPPGGRQGGGPKLRLAFTVGEGWHAVASADGQHITLLGKEENEAVNYGKLVIWDANGSPVNGALLVEEGKVIIEVDDGNAAYPLTIDPTFALQQKLVAADGAANDQFGYSVAISGETAVIGAFADDVGANADQGSAYVFVRSGATWVQQAKLTAADGAANDYFGITVAISGDTVVAGAYGDDVGGNTDQGSAYVFVRSGTVWTQQAKLTAADGAANDFFGTNVAISGDTVVVGAYIDDVGANVDQGSAYVFVRSGATWTQQQRLVAADGAANDRFGISVGISGDTVVVGAYLDDVTFTDQGSAYVFVRSGTTWTQQQKLTSGAAAAGGDYFGYSVSISGGTGSGDTVAVGAYGKNVPDGNGGFVVDQGEVFVFTRSGTVWTQQQILRAADGATGDLFGTSVAISGDTLVVGVYADDVGANVDQGSAYVFTRSGTFWTQQRQLTAADGATGDRFGISVAISGETVVVGAYSDDVGANADQGSVSVFTQAGPPAIAQAKLTAADGAAFDSFGASVAISGDTAVVGADGDDVNFTNQGSAYVFVRNGTVWTFQQKLTAADGAADDNFGFSVAISGETVVVGAPGHKVSFEQQGAAYVFVRSGATWTLQQKLTDTGFLAVALEGFGFSVAISNETLAIGALGAFNGNGAAFLFTRSGVTWTNNDTLGGFGAKVAISGDTLLIGKYNQGVGGNMDQGSATVLVRSGASWSLQATLTASDGAANAHFGNSVAVSGDNLVVGAPNIQPGKGTAYVFTRSGTAWTEHKLIAPDGVANNFFGWGVAISGDTAVVGAMGGPIQDQGGAYVFTRSGSVWTQQQKLTAADGASGDGFGNSVAISGETALVGVPGDDSFQGSAYVFVPCRFDLSPAGVNLPVGGGGGSFTVSCAGNCAWVAAALPAWLTITSSASGTGNGTITFTAAANPGLPRTSSISVSGSNFVVTQDGTCALTINQAALPGGITTTPYNQPLTASGGNGSYNWQLVNATTLPPGLSLSAGGVISGTPTAGSQGNYTFTIAAVDPNGCVGSRTYTMNVATCAVISLSPTSQVVTGAGGSFNFTVTAPGCAWTTLSNAPWLTVTVNPTGTGNLVVGYSVAANSGAARTGLITVNNQVFTVAQEAGAANNGLQFYPLPRPVRLMDTRANQGNCDNVSAPINAGTSLTIPARTTCEGIVIPASAKAVVGNLTVINQDPQNAGYLTIYPDGVPAPLASNMIYYPGKIIANNFTVALSSDGKFNVFGERTIDVVIDISGYYAPPGAGGLYYHPLAKPVRLLDTRPNQGTCDNVSTPIAAGTSVTAQARATCEGLTIPPTAQAIAANATVINQDPQNAGYLTIYPNGVPVPLASNLIYYPGQIISNAFTVSLNGSGEFNIYGQRKIDMIVDVAGYDSAEASDANGQGLLFNPLPRPLRILDTRANQGNCDNISTPIVGGTSIAALGRLTCEGITIPAEAQSLLGNATVINQTSQAGYLTLYPDGFSAPLISNMVYFPGQLLANAFVVGVNAGTGQFRIFGERTLDAVVDVSGFFAP